MDGNYIADEALENAHPIYWKDDAFQVCWIYKICKLIILIRSGVAVGSTKTACNHYPVNLQTLLKPIIFAHFGTMSFRKRLCLASQNPAKNQVTRDAHIRNTVFILTFKN
jgi:hypothetical protein